MITQNKEKLDFEEEPSTARLKQKRQAIQLQSELLLKLDGEILEMFEEDIFDEEVEQADIVEKGLN